MVAAAIIITMLLVGVLLILAQTSGWSLHLHDLLSGSARERDASIQT